MYTYFAEAIGQQAAQPRERVIATGCIIFLRSCCCYFCAAVATNSWTDPAENLLEPHHTERFYSDVMLDLADERRLGTDGDGGNKSCVYINAGKPFCRLGCFVAISGVVVIVGYVRERKSNL